MNVNSKLFSGEPMPIPPKINDPEMAAFVNKLMDYLRRLVTKMSQAIDVEGESTAAFVSKLAEDQVSVPYDTNFVVEWTEDLHLDTGFYAHLQTTDPDEITVKADGVYIIMFDVMHTVDAYVDFWVEILVDSTWSEVEHGFLLSAIPNDSSGMVVGVPLVAGTKIRISGMAQAGGTSVGVLDIKCTRISIIRVHQSADGGGRGGVAGGIGWDNDRDSAPSWASGVFSP